MTLDQIRYFCAAAELGNFSKAAERSNISQPSLCIAIRKLESEFNVKLFLANRKGAVLTEAGRVFFQDAQNILQQIELAATHMDQFAHMNRAQLRIAYTSSFADAYIPRVLKAFLAEEGADCSVYSDEMPSDQIAQGIREGRFDLGLGSRIPPDPEIELVPIEYQPFCLLIPREMDASAYASRSSLHKSPLICYRKDYPMYRQLSDLFSQWQIEPHIIHYAYSEGAIARLVEQCMGIAIVAEIEGLDRYDVTILHPQWLDAGRQVYLMRHRTRMLSQAAQQFQDRILNQ